MHFLHFQQLPYDQEERYPARKVRLEYHVRSVISAVLNPTFGEDEIPEGFVCNPVDGCYRLATVANGEDAIDTVCDFLDESIIPSSVTFVCFDVENFRIYEQLLQLNA